MSETNTVRVVGDLTRQVGHNITLRGDVLNGNPFGGEAMFKITAIEGWTYTLYNTGEKLGGTLVLNRDRVNESLVTGEFTPGWVTSTI